MTLTTLAERVEGDPGRAYANLIRYSVIKARAFREDKLPRTIRAARRARSETHIEQEEDHAG